MGRRGCRGAIVGLVHRQAPEGRRIHAPDLRCAVRRLRPHHRRNLSFAAEAQRLSGTTGCINAIKPPRSFPQGLKPLILLAVFGTTEVVPFQTRFLSNPIYATSSRTSTGCACPAGSPSQI